MKVLTIILALLVVTLSVSPCCITDGCASDDAKTEQSENHKEDSDICSPFYSCSTCIGFTFSDYSVEPATFFQHKTIHFADYRQSMFPPFYNSFWQPPRLS
ncbi:DUF6660 family protein [Pontibacter vulgaris]|uniref:DUF6660 family protein n=1 Tax=Pontibacter vulgaris TaxID=2905679 RepID=UPI0034636262